MRIYKMTDDIPRRLDGVVNTEGEGANYRLYGSSAVVLIFDGVFWLCGIGEGVPHFCPATLCAATMQIQKEGMQSSVLHCHSSEYNCGNLLALDVRTELQ